MGNSPTPWVLDERELIVKDACGQSVAALIPMPTATGNQVCEDARTIRAAPELKDTLRSLVTHACIQGPDCFFAIHAAAWRLLAEVDGEEYDGG